MRAKLKKPNFLTIFYNRLKLTNQNEGLSRMNPYVSNTPTYYHCDSCRKMNVGAFHKCYVYQKILCPRCNLWGLCPDHFSRLSPQHQTNLHIYDREFARSRFLKNMYGVLGYGLLFVFILVTIFWFPSILTYSLSSPNYAWGAGITLAVMWGPGFLLAI
ncbi:MAG: hypothetical protein RBG13Loki_4028 [Promethearchaeota archaeon CR_4]|nr:MAG: hypothetical protein RBG13Loki_4028 [Candidatus Lokiarchaeota archaeon CR_4]